MVFNLLKRGKYFEAFFRPSILESGSLTWFRVKSGSISAHNRAPWVYKRENKLVNCGSKKSGVANPEFDEDGIRIGPTG